MPQSFERGFAYETNAGQNSSCGSPLSTPGNNWGDGGPGCTAIPGTVTWCFNIDVKACPPGSDTYTGEDLTVSVQVLSDAFSGSWDNQVCGTPTFETIATVVVCDDEEPIAIPTAEDCPNAENGFFDIQGNGGLTPGELYNFTVRDASSNAVYICNGCPSPITTTNLLAGDYTIEAIGIVSGCPQVTMATIEPGTPVDVAIDFPPACPGSGAIELTGSTTYPGTTFTYDWTGPNGFTASGQSVFTNDPADEGIYTLTISVDGCDSEPFETTIEYIDYAPEVYAVNDNLCFGDDIELEVINGGTDYEWFDPDGNLIGGNTSTIITTAGGVGGIQVYTVNVSDANCTVPLTVEVFVSDEITGQIIMDPNGQVCAGEPIEFMARMSDGSFFPGNWTFDWDNNGPGTNPNYTLTENTPGNYTMEVTVINPAGCSALLAEPFIVNQPPTVSIDPVDATICADGSVEITATASGGTGSYTYLWGPDEVETSDILTVDANSTTTQAIYVVVTDQNGCSSFSNFADVAILPSLNPVAFDACVSNSPTEITFTWNDVGQDAFEIYLTEGSNPEQTISTTYAGLTYTAMGITPGTNVTIRVVPVATNGGVTCSGPGRTITCSSQSCPNPGWVFTAVEPVCLTTDGQAFDLTINTGESGTVVLNSTDLGLNDQPNGPGGTTSISLPALTAGTTSDVYTVLATFAQPDGSCAFDTTFNIPVVTPAEPEISTPLSSICSAQANVRFTLVNDYDPNSVYTISVDGGSGSFITLGDAPNRIFEISFSEYRTYQVTVTATTRGNNGCSDSFTLPFTLIQPPARPTLTCAETGLDSVAFSWSDVGADNYTVDQISIPAGGTVEETPTGFIVRGLNAGDAATIAVTANIAGCSPVISDTITCVAQSCATIVPIITTPVDTFCSDGSEMLVDLTVDVPAAGTVEWSSGGNGVSGSQFDPAAAGAGEHVITVVYTEGTCTYPASFQLVVVDPPAGTLDIAATDICQGETTVVSFNGTNLDNAEFEWILPEEAVVIGGDVNGPGPLDVTFSRLGGQFAQLVITGPFCEIDTLRDSIQVAEPLEAVFLECANVSFDQVGFVWSHASATNFIVDIIDRPAGATVTQNNNDLLATGLAEGESVTIEVTAISDNVCPDAPPVRLTCTAQSCPDITFSIDPIGPFCVGEDVNVQLQTSVTGDTDGSGTSSFSDSAFSTGGSFSSAGLSAGTYTVSATFSEAGCTYPASIDIEVTELPDPSFNLAPGPFCVGEVVGADAGAMQVGVTYAWNIPGTDATVVQTSSTTRDISWSTPGMKDVILTVTDAGGCEDTRLQSVEVVAPLAAPVIGCGISSVTSVEFNWTTEAGVDSFLVTVDGGTPFFQDSTNLFLDGLSQGDNVNIEIIAFGSGVCGNSPVGMGNCEAGSCPTITVVPPADQAFCLGSTENDLILNATQTGAAGTGLFSFSGPGVTETAGVYTFNADDAGEGIHLITANYNESVCSGTAAFELTVNTVPSSNFTLNGLADDLTICEGEPFILAYSGDLPQTENGIFTWDFQPANGNPDGGYQSYNLSYADAGSYEISLSVSSNGCESEVSRLNVTVEAPLPAPVVVCTGSTLNSATFSWEAVPGAEGYVLSNGTTLSANELSYTASDLTPGESLSISVTALSSASCGDSQESVGISCSADECPTLSLDASSLQNEVCLLNGDETIDLSTVLVTGGVGNANGYVFSGPGVTGNIFDAAAAGGNEAGTTHTINVEYTEEGSCSFMGSFEITVFERPTAFITEVAPQCLGDTVVVLINSTNFVSNDDITVDWDGGIVLEDGAPDDNSYSISWETPGTKNITASVISNISGCPSLPAVQPVIVEAPLQTPVISCTDRQLESITFSWDEVAGATGYQIILNNAVTAMVDTTSYTVTDLSPETFIGISVTALGDTPCGNSPAGTATCETLPCPGGSVQAVTQSRDICLAGDETPILLEAELDMGTPSGPFIWSGIGVVDLGNGNYTFDPDGLPAGNYPLDVTYIGEANCTSTDQITINLYDLPSADFVATESLICAGSETLISINGPAMGEATYDWTFPRATPASATGPLQNFSVIWDEAGTHTIQLTVTSNGCTEFMSMDIEVASPPSAGNAVGDDLQRCAGNSEVIDLNELIAGQDEGGIWGFATNGNPGGAVGVGLETGVFDAGFLPPGDYRFAYTIPGTTCPTVSTEVGLLLLGAPVADAGPEQRLTCSMGMVSLNGSGSDSGPGFTYRWFSDDPNLMIMDGDQTMIDVGQPGVYQLEVTNAIGCSSVSEVIVTAETEAPVLEVDISQITCFQSDDGAILVTGVNGGRAPYTFTLNGEERGQSTLFAGLEPREYDLMVTDANGCFSNILLDLREPEELTIRLRFPGDSSETSYGEEIFITASVNGGNAIDTLIWQPDSVSYNDGETFGIQFTARETQMISVTVVDELGCTATDREMLLVRKDRPVYFPTAFSPNGDNNNDIFFIGGDLDEIDFIEDFFIFDRWGEAVYTGGQIAGADQMPAVGGDGARFLPNDPEFGWDGRLNGKVMNPQVLVYTATVHFTDGEVIVYKGDFVLLR